MMPGLNGPRTRGAFAVVPALVLGAVFVGGAASLSVAQEAAAAAAPAPAAAAPAPASGPAAAAAAAPQVLGSDSAGVVAPAGTAPAGAGAAAPGGLGNFLPFLLIGVPAIMMLTTAMGSSKEKKKRQAMLSALAKHDRVQTVGGIIGTIVELRDDEMVLKVDESSNTRIRFARSAIQTVLKTSGGVRQGETSPEPEAASV